MMSLGYDQGTIDQDKDGRRIKEQRNVSKIIFY